MPLHHHWSRTALATALAGVSALVFTCPAPAAASDRTAPNGRIVFDHDDGPIYTVDPDGTDLVQVADHGDLAAWSSDSRRISLADTTPDGRVTTALVNADGSGYTSQPIPDPTLNLECPAWAPDDRRLACEGWDDVATRRPAGVFTVRARGWDHLERVTTNPFGGNDIPGEYSPDGTRVVFAREDPRRGELAVFVVDTRTRRTRQVTPWQPDLPLPRWSPDGRWILFDSQGSLLLARPHGGRVRTIRLRVPDNQPRFAFHPRWSPDGTKIVFSLFTQTGPDSGIEGIYTANADGTAVRPVALAPDGFFSNADWGSAPTIR